MKKLAKILCVICAMFAVSFAFVGCNGNDNNTSGSNTPTPPVKYTQTQLQEKIALAKAHGQSFLNSEEEYSNKKRNLVFKEYNDLENAIEYSDLAYGEKKRLQATVTNDKLDFVYNFLPKLVERQIATFKNGNKAMSVNMNITENGELTQKVEETYFTSTNYYSWCDFYKAGQIESSEGFYGTDTTINEQSYDFFDDWKSLVNKDQISQLVGEISNQTVTSVKFDEANNRIVVRYSAVDSQHDSALIDGEIEYVLDGEFLVEANQNTVTQKQSESLNVQFTSVSFKLVTKQQYNARFAELKDKIDALNAQED